MEDFTKFTKHKAKDVTEALLELSRAPTVKVDGVEYLFEVVRAWNRKNVVKLKLKGEPRGGLTFTMDTERDCYLMEFGYVEELGWV